MRIETVQQPIPPPPVIEMSFTRGEGWAVLAALRDYATLHPHAVDVEKWREWANALHTELHR